MGHILFGSPDYSKSKRDKIIICVMFLGIKLKVAHSTSSMSSSIIKLIS